MIYLEITEQGLLTHKRPIYGGRPVVINLVMSQRRLVDNLLTTTPGQRSLSPSPQVNKAGRDP